MWWEGTTWRRRLLSVSNLSSSPARREGVTGFGGGRTMFHVKRGVGVRAVRYKRLQCPHRSHRVLWPRVMAAMMRQRRCRDESALRPARSSRTRGWEDVATGLLNRTRSRQSASPMRRAMHARSRRAVGEGLYRERHRRPAARQSRPLPRAVRRPTVGLGALSQSKPALGRGLDPRDAPRWAGRIAAPSFRPP